MPGDPIHVLAADDSRTIRDIMAKTLQDAGVRATFAHDGQAGIERLDALAVANDLPDVIVTDVNMPRLDGFGLIDAVRRNPAYDDVPIIVLTTEDGRDLKKRARDAGARGWIVKPFDPLRLVHTLRAVTSA